MLKKLLAEGSSLFHYMNRPFKEYVDYQMSFYEELLFMFLCHEPTFKKSYDSVFFAVLFINCYSESILVYFEDTLQLKKSFNCTHSGKPKVHTAPILHGYGVKWSPQLWPTIEFGSWTNWTRKKHNVSGEPKSWYYEVADAGLVWCESVIASLFNIIDDN